MVPISVLLGYAALGRQAPGVYSSEPAQHAIERLMLTLSLMFVLSLLLLETPTSPFHLLTGVLIPPLVWCWFFGFIGVHKARTLALPVSLLYFALPWEFFLRDIFDKPLQAWTADIALQLLRLCGYPLRYWNDHTIYTEKYYVIVNETCSGMNLLVTLSLYVLVYAWFLKVRFADRIKLLALVFPLALVANGLRVAIIYLLGHYGGVELADGFWHTGSAYALFVPVFWFIYVVNEALSKRAGALRTR